MKRVISLMLAAVTAASLLAGCGGTEDTSGAASLADEASVAESASSEAVSSEEAVFSENTDEQSQADKVELDWEFKKDKAPEFADSTYSKVIPFEEARPDIVWTTAKPSYSVNYEETAKKLRENPVFAETADFAEFTSENSTSERLLDVGFSTRYISENDLVGYKKGSEPPESVFVISPENDNELFKFEAYTKHCYYDAPNTASLAFGNLDLTQDEVYDIVKDVFGEDVGKYLVYSEMTVEKENDSDEDYAVRWQNEIFTPDEKGRYLLQRIIRYENEGFCYYFNVSYKDSEVEDKYKDEPDNPNGYKPIEPALDLSKMFDADIGQTDLHKPQSLFDKAQKYGLEGLEYAYTDIGGLKSIVLKEVKYSDGSVRFDYEVQADRRLYTEEKNRNTSYESDFGGEVKLELNGTISPEKKVTVSHLLFTVPNSEFGEHSAKLDDKTAKVYDQCLVQIKELFGVTDDEIKAGDFAENSSHTQKALTIKDHKMKLFGEEISTAKIEAIVISDGNRSSVTLKYDM